MSPGLHAHYMHCKLTWTLLSVATFDEQVGLSYLRGMHLNDSKTPLGSKKDRHENIGLYVSKVVLTDPLLILSFIHLRLPASCAAHPTRGTLKLSAFLTILSDPRVQNIPLILETPTFEAVEVWECEIRVLNMLSEVGGGSGGSAGEEGNMGREEMLKELMGDIRNVVREKGGKKSTSAMSKSRGKSRKREMIEDEEEDGVTDSEDAQSCAKRSG